MNKIGFFNNRARLYEGDCLEVLKTLPDNCIDSIVTDPPYHLTSIVKRFGKEGSAECKEYDKPNSTGAYKRSSKGFMNQTWDGGDIAFNPELWSEVLRVLKPGGHLVSFAATKNYHRMACAIEDAGFEIRDMLSWLYGTGFPKNHDISKNIDKTLGVEREKIKIDAPKNPPNLVGGVDKGGGRPWQEKAIEQGYHEVDSDDPISDEAKQWQGWGTALKPAHEDIVLAMKPFNFDNDDLNEIIVNLKILESKIWSLLNVNVVEEYFPLNLVDFSEACAFAQWNAEERSNIQEDLLDQMDMSQFVLAIRSSLNTVFSWRNIWEEVLKPENTSIIKMKLNTITDLRTLKLLLSRITPGCIIKAHKNGLWESVNASLAEKTFYAINLQLSGILELFALENATELKPLISTPKYFHPFNEPICFARKPLSEDTIAKNVLKWGTGAINIDISRVPIEENDDIKAKNPHTVNKGSNKIYGAFREDGSCPEYDMSKGRWPANVITDGSEEVIEAFPSSKSGIAVQRNGGGQKIGGNGIYQGSNGLTREDVGFRVGCSNARFFYSAKATKKDRADSKHPTVKPIKLMQWLINLITPPNGIVLDPFAGSGTTGEAALLDGFRPVMIEKENGFCLDIINRMEKLELDNVK